MSTLFILFYKNLTFFAVFPGENQVLPRQGRKQYIKTWGGGGISIRKSANLICPQRY
jgi:hypothetical protein